MNKYQTFSNLIRLELQKFNINNMFFYKLMVMKKKMESYFGKAMDILFEKWSVLGIYIKFNDL